MMPMAEFSEVCVHPKPPRPAKSGEALAGYCPDCDARITCPPYEPFPAGEEPGERQESPPCMGCGEPRARITEKNRLIADALMKESDRGCVLLGAALLDEALEQLLRAFFRQDEDDSKRFIEPLFQGYAPLATFSGKIQMAYALAVLPRKIRDRIEIIRRLRNDFANAWRPIDFDDQAVRSRLELLIGSSSKYPPSEDHTYARKVSFEPHIKEAMVRRLAFIVHISRIAGHLLALTERARKGQDIRKVVLIVDAEGRDPMIHEL
jgi:DNA-binding MltR family transcriptional regulator